MWNEGAHAVKADFNFSSFAIIIIIIIIIIISNMQQQ